MRPSFSIASYQVNQLLVKNFVKTGGAVGPLWEDRPDTDALRESLLMSASLTSP